jgi:hypothetical protein
MAYPSTMIGESSYDIISHMTSMENRLMQKISDLMESQKSLMKRYMEMRDTPQLLSSKLCCSNPADSPSLSRAPTITLPIGHKEINILPKGCSVGAAKVPLLSIKRNPSNEFSHGTRVQANTLIELKKIVGDRRTPNQIHHREDILMDPCSPAFPSPGRTESVEAVGSDVSTEALGNADKRAEDTAEPDDAGASSRSKFRKAASIKDSAAMFHKDFKAAR